MQSESGSSVLDERVDRYMSGNVTTVLVSDTLDLVVARMKALRIAGFPVLDPDGKLVAVVSEIDVARSLSPVKGVDSLPGFLEMFLRAPRDDSRDPFQLVINRLRHLRVGSCMTSPAVTINAGGSIREAAELMVGRRINRLPVVDSNGRLVGIITRTDLIRALSGARETEAARAAPRGRVQAVIPA
ncbi:MAG: CBS domain-containing protein [Euryarchaeota archaeon]|nr:CBS domain-containing protein [Euryarchaeota archaeon]MDE1880469.1 CBS domain-containing protein [Euryarchaeota archaeon]